MITELGDSKSGTTSCSPFFYASVGERG